MQMWSDSKDFTLNVQAGWKLHLSTTKQIPVAEGVYHGRISSREQGFEIRKDKNFISARPLYVYKDDPHPQLLKLWSAKQDLFSRDDCSGFVPDGLRPKKVPNLRHLLRHLSSRLSNISEYGDTCRYYDEYNDSDEDEEMSKIELPNNAVCQLEDCMFLGTVSKQSLTLSTIIEKELYAVHTKTNELVGYLITVGIWGPDIKRFHSDEGYYEVAVMFPEEDDGTDFMALLGSQNCLIQYELDELEGRVDWRDLEWFDERSEKYYNESHSRYVN